MSTQTPIDSRTAERCGALPFDRLQAKVQVPAPRPGSVSRTALVNRLRAARSIPVVTIVTPAGYGKTTALAQWAERDERPFAWVSVDERDDDPAVLVRHLAAALDGCEPLDPSVLRAVRAPGKALWTSAVPRLASAFASLESPAVVVLDDASRLCSKESVELLTVLAQHVPDGSTLALSGRVTPPLPIAQLRAAGRLLEIGPELLALNPREAENLLRASGVELTDEQVATLLDRTEGWAAGLYLAALAIRDGGTCDATGFAGDDRYLGDYFRSACLPALPPERLDFLRRTSILEWMSGPLCDAVLETTDSAHELEALEDAGLFVVPLDHHRGRFRYHSLFRDLLGCELAHDGAAGTIQLHRRASAWFETAGDANTAIGHAVATGDMDHVARLVGALALPECDAGRVAAAERWLGLFGEDELERYALVAATGAWVHALRGRTADAERWLAAAENGAAVRALPIGGASTRPLIALVRAALCRDAAERLALEARAVGTAGAHPETAFGALAAAVAARALLRRGCWDEARAELETAEKLRPTVTRAIPWLAVQTLLELARARLTLPETDRARALATEAAAILRRRPDLGAVTARVGELQAELDDPHALRAGTESRLTTAELRLLPLLATHLSFREIGARLYVSRNTIKTQAISVYRKLGVSSRSDAIAEATRLGLLTESAT